MRSRLALAGSSVALLMACAAATAEDEGIVVVAVSPGTAGAAAGVQVGDRFDSWSQGAASGPLRSPFDLAEAALEQGPRGPVHLVGTRAAEPLAVDLFPDDWGIEARPIGLDASSPDLEAWRAQEAARAGFAKGDVDGAAAAVEDGVRAARAAHRPAVEAQLLAFLAGRLRDADRLDAAQKALARALEVRRAIDPSSLATASLGEPIGIVAYAQGGPEDERDAIVADAQARIEKVAPESLANARALVALAWLQGHPKGRESFARALAIAERLAPESLAAVGILRAVAWVEGDRPKRFALFERAARLQERFAPETKDMVSILSALGQEHFYRGEMAAALESHRRALELVGRIAPGSAREAHALNSMAIHWVLTGDLVQAETYYRRALAIDERLTPGSVLVGIRLFNLGELLTRRREFEAAETYLARALELSEKYSPGGAVSGRILYVLGQARLERGDAAGAEAALRRALEIMTAQGPDQLGNVRERLADVLAAAGHLDEAQALYEQNLAEVEKGDEGPYVLAMRHHPLGALAWRRGDLDAAERHHRAALDLRRATIPGSVWHAESSHALGQVARRRGRTDEALALFREAVAAFDAQLRLLGGSAEARARFRTHYQDYSRDLEELLFETGRSREAFEALEASRARGMAALLASRDLALDADVPAGLDEERRRADLEYDRCLEALKKAGDAPSREGLGRALAEARKAQADVRARIRASAPRRGALRDPTPLDLVGAQQALEPGTVLLAFSLGAESARVYAVGPGPEEFVAVPLGADGRTVGDAVSQLRRAIAAHRGRLGQATVAAAAARLSERLLGPVREPLGRARGVLVVPDGPLYALPWALLTSPADARALVESRPVTVVSSVTLYASLTPATATATPRAAVGFGDPVYAAPPAREASRPSERATAASLRLQPLPGTRREVESLRALRADAHLFLGSEATEENAKAIGRDARFVHFACHGLLDAQSPLESGLALSIPAGGGGRDNGFLQAWEVFESVRLDADLVTLSACETGLGREVAGEGLLGLTWAFQYAGARSVLASLWEVGDASTADLMGRFYRNLAAGTPKAEALRRAQAELRRRPATSSPYSWAAFSLVGASR